jgi:hypothetical protein
MDRPEPDTAIQGLIDELWKYAEQYLSELKPAEVDRDFPEMAAALARGEKFEAMALKFSASAIIHTRLGEKLRAISPLIYFVIHEAHIALPELHPVIENRLRSEFSEQEIREGQVVNRRYRFILTTACSPGSFLLVDQIYAAATRYKIPCTWQIMKYRPAMALPPEIRAHQVLGIPSSTHYELQTVEINGARESALLLVFNETLDPPALSRARAEFIAHLSEYFGEYELFTCLRLIGAIPRNILEAREPRRVEALRPIDELFDDARRLKPDVPRCYICCLKNFHVDLTEFGGRQFCGFCLEAFNRLNSGLLRGV